ncbi:MAG: response regulator [Ruminococcaceae bacterium]|nr:response regulator [Oscillospiraceae bacterium]
MRILIAAPDRDLLTAYDKLLTGSGHAVVTAFDGTQVMRLLAGRGFDLAILDRCLPRADVGAVTAALRRESTRSVLLQDHPVRPVELRGETAPDACLAYPFLPGELLALLESLPPLREAEKGYEAVNDHA